MGKALKNKSTCTQAGKAEYNAFHKIDGSHSWQSEVPEGCILYPVRELRQGEVLYFNYELAKEMGLIPKSHPRAMNAELKKALLETFSIRIINEFDQENNLRYHPKLIKKNKYMATRYLQLQHTDKTGRTSGDGRCIWNGEYKYRGKTWDISSRGTGVTALSPGAVQAGKPLESGNTEHGYGCGMAEIDELFGSAIMAEAFHYRGINTERMLAIIDTGNGYGIGVRASTNLFRPAHFFGFLKQNNFESLKKTIDFFIQREISNGNTSLKTKGAKKYDILLSSIVENFSDFVATLDREYIFAWLDWDGDNVLATAGIIDYGSIRQFGLRHDQYRYDDVDRFSTNLNEQKIKAQNIIQVFCQAVEFLKTGHRPTLEDCVKHPQIEEFRTQLENKILFKFIEQMGIDKTAQTKSFLKDKVFLQLFKTYSSLESYKTARKIKAVSDGVNRPAILNMRKGLNFIARCYSNGELPSSDSFFKYVLTDAARGKDRQMSYGLNKKIQQFIELYANFLGKNSITPNTKESRQLFNSCVNHNPIHRMTGDGLIYVVDKIMNIKKHGRAPSVLIQNVIDSMVQDQSPANIINLDETQYADRLKRISEDLRSIIDGYSESI